MLLLVSWFAGCSAEEEVAPPLPPAPEILPVVKERKLEIPTTAPTSGEDIAGGGVVADTPAVGGAPTEGAAPPPEDGFNPISVPQGPRDGGGVTWKGVKSKPSEQTKGKQWDTIDGKPPKDL